MPERIASGVGTLQLATLIELGELTDVRHLQLRRIGLDAPSDLLDKIVRYEAVHPVRDSRDLHRRLAEDRRCFALVHPALPDEPLIITELALTRGMGSNIQAILDPDSPTVDPEMCNCAIFYSISNCHQELRGVPFGNALILCAADAISLSLPLVKTFATLSPVTGFTRWLTTMVESGPDGATRTEAMAAIAAMNSPDWFADVHAATELQNRLVPLCAYYLLCVRNGNAPADPVARFHLRNGARLDRINWLADTSPLGMGRSAGLMVNYLYRSRVPGRQYDATRRTRPLNAARSVARLARLSAA